LEKEIGIQANLQRRNSIKKGDNMRNEFFHRAPGPYSGSFPPAPRLNLGLILMFLLVLLWILPSSTPANAAVTINISPSGNLDFVNSVNVEFLFNFSEGYSSELSKITHFDIKFNGVDITQVFLEFAMITHVSSTQVKGEFNFIFETGSYKFSSTVRLAGESPVTATTTFTVPGDDQLRRKNTVFNKIEEFIHLWDSYKFAKSISIGDEAVFKDVIFNDHFDIYVDPGRAVSQASQALYYPGCGFFCGPFAYWRDLVIGREPESFETPSTNQPTLPNSSALLWHEVIHAIDHDRELQNDPVQLSGDDHLYLEWAESAIGALSRLIRFESFIEQKVIANPPDPEIANRARTFWKLFATDAASSPYHDPEVPGDSIRLPTAAEKGELRDMIGFDIDPVKIRSHYESLGYPTEYFDGGASVTITSPASGTEVTEDQVDVMASLVTKEFDMEPSLVGFVINGTVQLVTLYDDDTFFTRATLTNGDNSIQAGMVSSDGRYFLSQPITIKKRNALLYDFSRITGADVSLGGLNVEIYNNATGQTQAGGGGGGFPGSGTIFYLLNDFSDTRGQRPSVTNFSVTLNDAGDELVSVDLVQNVWDSAAKTALVSRKTLKFASLPLSYASPDGSYFIYAIYGASVCDHISEYTQETFASDGSVLTEVPPGSFSCAANTSLTVNFTSGQ
jgi:hypothetical protein